MSDNAERIINKVRNLLSKTVESGCTEAEAALAAERVQQILTRHKLDMSQVLDGDDKNGRRVLHEVIEMGIDRGVSWNWCEHLANEVAKATFCRALFYTRTRQVLFIGEKDDVAVAKELYTFIAEQGLRLCRDEWQKLDRFERKFDYPKGYGWFRLPFMLGLVNRVTKKLRETVKDPDVLALVKVTDEQNKDYIQKSFKVRSSNSGYKGALCGAAWSRGYEAGESVKIARQKEIV